MSLYILKSTDAACRGWGCRLAAGQPDILSGVRLQAQCPPTYASTDGLCFTAELRPNPPAEWNTLPRLLRRHYMAACPVTLSGWRRLRS